MEKKTPLYDCHVAAGGKIVPFGGYLLPVQYETGVISITAEVLIKLADHYNVSIDYLLDRTDIPNLQK